ncbi:DNA replication protein [Cricetid gammaherpesvirus 2]|uniref:DNA replication protein n=1 Tax=Cricetid gammaherpesvirus 2 TaxID=1605972 RepID=E9M5P2_9GAMA|nr:DNA replication protein [Cricetid gammaherpesvirus 2]ADW24400.1 DNA replication protein [Cricetid gammaherpesvirus 2]ADW24482.1 DNA replication protein [Cricetid gammaherpesvirus 2]
MQRTFEINTATLAAVAKVYNHVKGSACNDGAIQVSGCADNLNLTYVGAVGPGGVLRLDILDAVRQQYPCELETPQPCLFSFLNRTCLGRDFSHAGQMFGPQLKSMTLSFYTREETQYVESKFVYDETSKTVHTSAISNLHLPAIRQLGSGQLVGTIFLTTKTTMAMIKWLKESVATIQENIKICLNEVLNIMVISTQKGSKTFEYAPRNLVGESVPPKKGKGGTKMCDYGEVMEDLETWVNGHSFIRALHICKIPGMCLPALKFHSSGILDVAGENISPASKFSLLVSVVKTDHSEDQPVPKPESEAKPLTPGSSEEGPVPRHSQQRTHARPLSDLSSDESSDEECSGVASATPACRGASSGSNQHQPTPLSPVAEEASQPQTPKRCLLQQDVPSAPLKRKPHRPAKLDIKKPRLKFNPLV